MVRSRKIKFHHLDSSLQTMIQESSLQYHDHNELYYTKGEINSMAYTHPNHTGDVTSNGDGATTINSGVVTNQKLFNMAGHTIKGRLNDSGTPQDLSVTQARNLLNVPPHHPTGFSDKPAAPLTGLNVISQLKINTEGHVTGVETRTLTVDGSGGAAIDHNHNLNDLLEKSYHSLTDKPDLLAIGDTSTTAGRGDWTLTAYSHTILTNNPHAVSKEQVGLGNLTDDKQETEANAISHKTNYDNPHAVTKAQVDLGNVHDFGLATQEEAQVGTQNEKYMTPLRTREAIDAIVETLVFDSIRTARLTIGHVDAGWTVDDCDFLCEGLTDEITINSAIAALPVEGGEIVLLDGVYELAGKIVINKNNVVLRGNGRATELKRMWDSGVENEGMITIQNAYFAQVLNMSINGNKETFSAATNAAILVFQSGRVKILNNHISRSVKGVLLHGDVSVHVVVAHNTFFDMTDSFIQFETTGARIAQHLVIDANLFEDCQGRGIYLSGSDYGKILANTFSNCNGCGIFLHSCNETLVSENNLSDNHCGIDLFNAHKTLVHNNMCHRNEAHGIRLAFSNDAVVSGNHCHDNLKGIVIASCLNTLVSGNHCAKETYSTDEYALYLMGKANENFVVDGNALFGKEPIKGALAESFRLSGNTMELYLWEVTYEMFGSEIVEGCVSEPHKTAVELRLTTEGTAFTTAVIDQTLNTWANGMTFENLAAASAALAMGETDYTQHLADNDLQAIIADLTSRIVLLETKEIESVETLTDITVAFGTDLTTLEGLLPATVQVDLDDASTETLTVTWDTTGYDGNTAGTYPLQGTLTLTEGVANTGSHTASVNVIVEVA